MSRLSIRSKGGSGHAPPELTAFQIEPPIGIRGASVTLTWRASGYSELVVTTPSGRRLDLVARGQESVVLELERSGTYQLAARNEHGTVVATSDALMIELPDARIPAAPRLLDVLQRAATITDAERTAVMAISDGYGLVGDLLASAAPESIPCRFPSINEVMPRGVEGGNSLSAPHSVVDSAMRDASS